MKYQISLIDQGKEKTLFYGNHGRDYSIIIFGIRKTSAFEVTSGSTRQEYRFFAITKFVSLNVFKLSLQIFGDEFSDD